MKKTKFNYLILILGIILSIYLLKIFSPLFMQIFSHPLKHSAFSSIVVGFSHNKMTFIYWIVVTIVLLLGSSIFSCIIYLLLCSIFSNEGRWFKVAITSAKILSIISIITSLLLVLSSDYFNLISAIISSFALYQYLFPNLHQDKR